MHEIGHNLGAVHDEETINCKPRCKCQGALHHDGTGTVTCDSCDSTNTTKYIMAEKLSRSLLEFRTESFASQLWLRVQIFTYFLMAGLRQRKF